MFGGSGDDGDGGRLTVDNEEASSGSGAYRVIEGLGGIENR